MSARAAGILAHPSSLPSPFGVGDLGPGLTRFLRWLARSGQSVWQVLPLGPAAPGASPYDSPSAFAGNPLFISPERLLEDGLLRRADLDAGIRGGEPWNAPGVERWKEGIVRRAWRIFRSRSSTPLHDEYDRFVQDERHWIDDWSLFRAIKDHHGGRPWHEWSRDLAARERAAIAAVSRELADEIAFHHWAQFVFFRQWAAIRELAHEIGLRILGDVPIYVAIDSADVWAHQNLFHLDSSGRPTVVAGVPPDYFSPDGQRWGNPIYRWDRMMEDGFRWWIERLRANLELADLVRLDHFRGFSGYWEIPASEPTARKGRWVEGPGAALFEAVRATLGSFPFIAEDLGTITPDVEALRTSLGLPAMRVLQFAFGDDDNIHLPSRYDEATVAYTGTHDNDTTRGWFEALDASAKRRVRSLIGEGDVVEGLIRVLYDSRARMTIVPLQDALGLGSEARMNRPGLTTGNWMWHVDETMLDDRRAESLNALASAARR